MWLVVKIMVPFWVPIIIRPLIFRVPKKGTIILTTTHVVLEVPCFFWPVVLARSGGVDPCISPYILYNPL